MRPIKSLIYLIAQFRCLTTVQQYDSRLRASQYNSTQLLQIYLTNGGLILIVFDLLHCARHLDGAMHHHQLLIRAHVD
jgi:hypothetical protein